MKIEVTPGIYWDSEAESQSEEAIEWLQSVVRPNLSETTLDAFNRPFERTYSNDVVTVIERQIYINECYEWARSGVHFTVTTNTTSNDL